MQRFLSFPKPKPTVIFIIGGPCSGKTSQISLIQNSLSFERIQISALIKQQSESPYSQHGQIILESIFQNVPIPSYVILSLILTAIKCSLSKNKKFIIQDLQTDIELWNTIMTEQSIVAYLVHLNCSDKTMMERKSEIGNEGVTDKFLKRLQEIEIGKEVLDMFKAAGKVVEVNGQEKKEKVFHYFSKFLMDLAIGGCKIQ